MSENEGPLLLPSKPTCPQVTAGIDHGFLRLMVCEGVFVIVVTIKHGVLALGAAWSAYALHYRP
jgi:hypothetical protein